MSVSVTTVDGLVIFGQVFKQGEEFKIPMDTIAAPAVPAAAPAAAKPVESVEPSSPVSPMTEIFLKGQPKQLGIVQIMIGLVTVSLSVTLAWQNPMWGVPIWCGAVFILSGFISITALRDTRPCLISWALALNVLCCVMAAAGITLVTVHFLIAARLDESGCQTGVLTRYSSYPGDYYYDCMGLFYKYQTVMDGVRWLLIALFAFQMAGWCRLRRQGQLLPLHHQAAVVIERPTIVTGDAYGSDEAVLGSEDALASPPPYEA